MEEWTICRLCLQANENTMKSFPDVTYNMIPFFNIYFELIGITLKEYPTFPAIICPSCEYEMVQAYKFRERCLETEEKLKDMLDEENTVRDENFECIVPVKSAQTEKYKSRETSAAQVKTNEQNPNKSKNSIKKYSPELLEELKDKNIKCKRCMNTYLGLDLFKVHKCPKTSTPETHQKQPKKKARRKIFQCKDCSKFFRSRTGYNIHMDKHKNNKRYECLHCGKGFFHWMARRTHTYKVHLNKTVYECADCGEGFYLKHKLSKHIARVHLKSHYFQCEVCGKKMSGNSSKHSHMLTHTEKGTCEICGKELKNMNTLKQHLKTHSGEKNYECTVCGGSFTCNFSLKNHIRKLHPNQTHIIPPDGTIVNVKFLKKRAEFADEYS